MNQFTFKNIQFRRGSFNLQVNLTLPEGKLTVILGPSGCGKTTLLDLAAGFLRPCAGGIFEGEREVTHLRSEQRRVGVVFPGSRPVPPHECGEKRVLRSQNARGGPKGGSRNCAG